VFEGDDAVGEVTRGVPSPALDEPVALALVDADTGTDLRVRVDGEEVPASRTALPFVEGSDESARLPRY